MHLPRRGARKTGSRRRRRGCPFCSAIAHYRRRGPTSADGFALFAAPRERSMQEFLQNLLQLPTLFFSAGLAISLLYWLLIIIGAADLNPFDGAEGALKGGVEGAMK